MISSIVGRNDDPKLQAILDYVNAACRLRLAGNSNVSFAINNNIDSNCLGSDKLHLKEQGTSRLASNIKKAVAKALHIQLVRKW